jgi:hypothetical protein
MMPVALLTMHCLIVGGLGGEQEYEQRFSAQAQTLEMAMRQAGPDVKSEALYGPAATLEHIRASLREIAKSSAPADTVMVVLIGHGSVDGIEYKFNIPGPDLTGTELASLLDQIKAQNQIVVNTTSASGGSREALEGPNRVVVTATRSGTEKNATVFARFWIDALKDASADTDKNEVINTAEAFKYAEQKTRQFYEAQKRLATEHPAMTPPDARIAVLRIGSIQQAALRPEKQALLAKREGLERQIDDLKLRKAALPTPEYRKQLQVLLIDLAKTQAEIDK